MFFNPFLPVTAYSVASLMRNICYDNKILFNRKLDKAENVRTSVSLKVLQDIFRKIWIKLSMVKGVVLVIFEISEASYG
jgi:abortive infection bacteriophage resistance protein